jgi:hypothetical protein
MAQTIRNFARTVTDTDAGSYIPLYKPGKIPANPDNSNVDTTNRVVGTLLTFTIKTIVTSAPVNTDTQWSGKSLEILLTPTVGAAPVQISRIDILSAAEVTNLNPLLSITGGEVLPFSPDTELGVRVIDAGHGFLAVAHKIYVFGAASETNESLNQQYVLLG